VKVILTTRVAPRNLLLEAPGVQRRLNLDQGLPWPFAENVLRAMDADGSLGIGDAPPALLALARERTRGFPRALEALVAILAADRDTSLADLLASTESMPENVVEALVGEAFNRLDTLAQQVMQALAIYPAPVPPVAVDYLLQPFHPAIDSARVLGRLVNMQFVRRDAGRYYLHQVDRDYAVQRLPVGEAEDRIAEPPTFSQYALRERAAEYFRQTRTPRETWKTLDDLAPQLGEFELRCQAGDFDTAATVLLEISNEYLQLWGHVRLARDLHERVDDHVDDPKILAANIVSLCNAYQALSQMRRAIERYEQALGIYRETGDRPGEGAVLTGLGNAYAALGEVRRAIEFYEQALAISREIGDRAGEGAVLTGLGTAYAGLGETLRAIEFCEQALTIDREVGYRQGEGIDLGNLGNRYSELGKTRRAIEFYEQALTIYRELGDRRGEGTVLANLGDEYANLGEAERALEMCEQAVGIFREIGMRDGEALALVMLTAAQTDLENWSQAITCGQDAVRIADEIELAQGSSAGRLQLAVAHLQRGAYDLARAHAQAAQGYDYAPMTDNAALVLGIALTREGNVEGARQAFRTALDATDRLLAETPDAYDELESRALALCGLALMGDSSRIDDAAKAFSAARAITCARGVVARALRLFDVLAMSDETGVLTPVRRAAAGERPTGVPS
jgi:tetratricopeptide (TPR) repeat protein